MKDFEVGHLIMAALVVVLLIASQGMAISHKEDMEHIKQGHCYTVLMGGHHEWRICK